MGRLTEEQIRKAQGISEDSSLLGTTFRGMERAARLGGLAVGTGAGALLDWVPGLNKWTPNVYSSTPDAFRAFWDRASRGDWDSAIEAYQDEMEAGKGFWGAAEIGGAFLPTGAPAFAGSRLISAAPKLARTLGRVLPATRGGVRARSGIETGARWLGKGLRAPWEAEEAVGRAAMRGIGLGARSIRYPRTGPLAQAVSRLQPGRGVKGVDDVSISGMMPEDAPLVAGRWDPQESVFPPGYRERFQGVSGYPGTQPGVSNLERRGWQEEVRKALAEGYPESIAVDPQVAAYEARMLKPIRTGKKALILRLELEVKVGSLSPRVARDAIKFLNLLPEEYLDDLGSSYFGTEKGIPGTGGVGKIFGPPEMVTPGMYTPGNIVSGQRSPGIINIAKILVNQTKDADRTIIHEVAHHLEDFVSAKDARTLVNQWQREMRNEGQPILDLIDTIRDQAAVDRLTDDEVAKVKDAYRWLGGFEEWFAEVMTDKALRDIYMEVPVYRNVLEKVVAQIKVIAKAAQDFTTNILGRGDQAERVYGKLKRGDYSVAERRALKSYIMNMKRISGTPITRLFDEAVGFVGRGGRGGVGGPPSGPVGARGPVGPGRPGPRRLPQQRSFDEVVIEAVGKEGEANFGRKLAQVGGIRHIIRHLNPAALADTVEAKAVAARHILLFEGDQQAQQFMTNLTGRFGSQEQVFGKLDERGLYADVSKMDKDLIGKAPTDIRQRSKQLKVRKLLTKEQQAWMDEAQRLEAANTKFLEDNGINIKYLKVSEGGIEYAGRRVYGKVVDGQVVDVKLVGPKMPSRAFGTAGKKMGKEKERIFETQQEAIEKGYRYLTDEETLLENIKAGQKRVTDKKFAEHLIEKSDNLVRRKGRKRAGELSAYKELYENKDFEKVYFRATPEGRKAAVAVARELTTKIPELKALNAMAKVNALVRFMELNADMGQFMIQLLFLGGSNPRVWGKAIDGFVKAWFDVAAGSNTWHKKLINDNRDLLNRHRGLITSIQGSEFTEAAERGGLLEKIPVVGAAISKAFNPFARAFNAAMDTAGIELAKSLEMTVKPKTAKEFADIDAFINEIRGLASSTRLGVSPTMRAVENNLLLAPRYNRAIAALLWDTVADGGLRGKLAREALIKSVGGLTLLAMAFKMVEYNNKTDEKDRTTEGMWKHAAAGISPWKPEFFTWEVGGTNIGPGTKVRSILALFGNSAEDPSSLFEIGSRNPFIRFARGNAAPVLSDTWDIFTGHNYIGEPTGWRDGWDEGFVDNIKRSGQTVLLPDIMPIWAHAALLESGGAGQRAARGTVEFFGGRAYPLRQEQMAQKIAKEQGFGDYETLDARAKHLVDRRVAEEMEAAGREVYTGRKGPKFKQKDKADMDLVSDLESVADKHLAGSVESADYAPRMARLAYNEARNQHRNYLYGDKWDEEKQRTIGGLLEDLYDMDQQQEEPEKGTKEHRLWQYGQTFRQATIPETGKLDFDKLDKVQGKFWASLTRSQVNEVLQNVRVLEGEYDSRVLNMVEAGRYAGSLTLNLGGEAVGYYDLEDHKMVEAYIARVTGVSIRAIREYLAKTIPEREAARKSLQGERIGKALDKAARKNGILWRLRQSFVTKAPKEWRQAMFEAGYSYQGKREMEERVFAKIRAGTPHPRQNYKRLYREALIGQ